MKQTLFILAFAGYIILFSCKKDKNPPPPPPPPPAPSHLVAVISKSTPTDSVRFEYQYDASKRLTKVIIRFMDQSTAPFLDVVYSGSTIIILTPVQSYPGRYGTDSNYLFMDANNRIIKRVRHNFWEYSAPETPNRRWVADTTTYQYDAQGLISSGIHTQWDTIWNNPGTPNTISSRTTGTITHSISGGNLVQVVENNQTVKVERKSTGDVTTIDGMEMTRSFEYSKSYPNKIDFSNAAVLDQGSGYSELPNNVNYRNQPDKMTIVYKLKDANGNVTFTYPKIENIYQLTYNAEGLVATKMDTYVQAGSAITKIYVYAK